MTEQQVEKTFNLAKKWSWEISLLRELWPRLGGALAIGGAAGSAIAILPGIFLLIPIGFAAIFGSLGRLFTGKWNPEIIEFLARYFGYFLNICFYLALPAATIVFLGGFAWFILQALWEQWQVPAFLRVWRTFVFLYEMGNPLCEKAKMLNTRIEALIEQGGEWFLPIHRAAQLLNLYQSEQVELLQINNDLQQRRVSYQSLSEKLEVMGRMINRTDEEAELTLVELDTEINYLSNKKNKYERSLNRLEVMIKRAENALCGIELHRQIKQETATIRASKPVRGVFEADIFEIFETELNEELDCYRELQIDLAIEINNSEKLKEKVRELKNEERKKKLNDLIFK